MAQTIVAHKQLPEFDYTPAPYEGPSREDVLTMRQKHCNPAVFTFYRAPLMLVDGRGQYVFDETGRRYLDLFAGIATVSCGHSHPKVVQAIQDQVGRLQHTSTIYLHPNIAKLAKKLASKMPPGLDVTYFTNSGSEANDLAINMARLYTGHTDVVAVRNGYHGGSAATMGLTSLHTWKYPIPQGTQIHHTVCPDPYRSRFLGTPEEIACQSAAEMRELIQFSTPGRIAAFLAEPIQGVGGATHGAANYLRLAFQIAREHGGLCISDEVQTGFGRTGEHYWGFQNFDVVPDMITLAKSFGNGMPLGAVATRMDIAQPLCQRLHFNTFGGNPVSMAAGLAVIEAIDEDDLQSNALKVGSYFKDQLKQLQQRHPIIGDVRGMGLMLGVELVEDRETKVPASSATAEVLEGCKERNILLGKGGLGGNVLRIKPPLCVTIDDVDYAISVLDEVLD